jgi:putative N6-adenine-specific DNA methylase
MPRFLAITSRGLLEPLESELQSIGIKRVRKLSDSVEFDSSWSDLYRVHLESRLTTRVLLPVLDFEAYNQDDLYHALFKRHDFTQYIFPHQTLRVEAHVREHKNLRDQRFVAMKTKDAIVDQFQNKFNERPSVGDEEKADLRIVIRVIGPKVSVALDLTGESMSNRGYRQAAGEAPVREHVAAGMLRMAKWSAPTPLVDPFCGSGTILIEAALTQVGTATLKRRRDFAFEKLANFQSAVYDQLKKEQPSRKAAPSRPYLFGYDKDASVIEKARQNARTAGVENWILFQVKDVRDLKAPAGVTPGLIITNPPYGVRLEDKARAKELMGVFASTLKKEFKGWNAFVLSGDPEVSAGMKLKAKARMPIWNGPIECRLLNYPVS